MNFLQHLASFFRQPQPISSFQKQSRLWFVLRGQIYVSPAEQDAKFFQACNKAFTPQYKGASNDYRRHS